MPQTGYKTIENLVDQMHIRHNDPIKEKQPGGVILKLEARKPNWQSALIAKEQMMLQMNVDRNLLTK